MMFMQLFCDHLPQALRRQCAKVLARLASWSIIGVASAVSIVGVSATLHAAVFTVTSAIDASDSNVNDGLCNDGAGNCTLRAAFNQANNLGGVNTINVPAGTYLLTAGLGPLTTTSGLNTLLTISGTGAPGSVIIDGQNATTVLRLGGNNSSVTLENLVLQNGKFTIANPGSFGACIGAGISVISDMTVMLSNSVVQNNTVVNGSGAGICVNFGTFTIDGSAVRNNTATYGGAGIRITGGAPPGKLIITNSTISGNVSTGDGNKSSSQGAGIFSQATIDMRNSTLSGNIVTGFAGALLAVNNSSTTMTNVTVSGNSGLGGQISLNALGDTITFESTLIANPLGPGGYNCFGGTATYVSNGHNLDSGNTCRMVSGTDLTNVNPSLGPLQNNGGPTATHALLSGSPAIDRGSNPLTFLVDQRGAGFARVSGAAADIGAFEFQGAGGVPTLDIDASGALTKYDALTDGLLTLRYLFGLTGSQLTQSALGTTATRTDPVAVKGYLDGIRYALDIDGNGTPDALTDGLMIVRYMFGLRGNGLIVNALGSNAMRTTPASIEAQIELLMP